jgi:hypothetical protein
MLGLKENTITIDEVLLPMRNINKPSISRALK